MFHTACRYIKRELAPVSAGAYACFRQQLQPLLIIFQTRRKSALVAERGFISFFCKQGAQRFYNTLRRLYLLFCARLLRHYHILLYSNTIARVFAAVDN